MRRRFKIAFVILLVATVVWTLAWWQHMIAYNQMRKGYEERLKQFKKWMEEHEEGKFVDILVLDQPFSWIFWGYGEFLAISGFIICVAWLFFLLETFEKWKKDKEAKNEKVGFVAKALGNLVALAILAFFYIIVLHAPIIF